MCNYKLEKKKKAPFALYICMVLKIWFLVTSRMRRYTQELCEGSRQIHLEAQNQQQQVDEYKKEGRNRERERESNNHGIIRESKSQWQSDGRRHCQESFFFFFHHFSLYTCFRLLYISFWCVWISLIPPLLLPPHQKLLMRR